MPADKFEVGPIIAAIEAFVRSFNFNRPGVDRSLGRDVAREVAGQIAARSATQFRGADAGAQWAANERKYAARKLKAYGWDHPNYRTGQMLSFASLLGTPVVEPELITMVYGTAERPALGATWSPHDRRNQSEKRKDAKVTDVQKAEWAHEGYAQHNRPPRPFYELDDQIRQAVVAVVAASLAEHMKGL